MIPEGSVQQSSRHKYTLVLTALLLLFYVRVSTQLIQAVIPVTFLPPFEAWESGALPYWLLLVSQALIIVVCTRVIWRLHKGLTIPSVKTGKALLMLGSIYFGLVCVRLVIGLTVATDHFWFGARLPTIFHFVLAGFVLVCGWFHYTASDAAHPRSLGETA